MTQLQDPFGRHIHYLRLSVTDRCNLRCVYCMAEDMQFLPKKQILSLEELYEVGKAFVALGVNKIRLTGGEPLVRKDLPLLAEQLTQLNGLDELTLTTNGVLLPKQGAALHEAGIRRVNVSLDTLDQQQFAKMTRGDQLPQVLSGLKTAKQLGMQVKLNCVVLSGQNDDAVLALTDYAVENGFDITFIEEMPLGQISSHQRVDTVVFSQQVLDRLSTRYNLLSDTYTSGGPARYHKLVDTDSRVGFISPHSNNFCSSCNRVRVTVEGQLLLCLGHDNAVDLRAVLRATDYTNDKLQQTIVDALLHKPEKHEFKSEETHIVRFMNMTGG